MNLDTDWKDKQQNSGLTQADLCICIGMVLGMFIGVLSEHAFIGSVFGVAIGLGVGNLDRFLT